MKSVQEIENEIVILPIADRLQIYKDMPNLISRNVEDLDWQRLGLEHFFEDDSSDDKVYDDV